MKRLSSSVVLLSMILVLPGCPRGSMGTITNEISDDLGFVADDDRIFFSPIGTRYGVERIDIDGGDRAVYFSTDYRLRDVMADASLWALGDPDNNLYTLHSPGATPAKVEAFDGRVAEARISPDGSTIAVALHADFSLPQEQQPDSVDDTIFLVDPDTHDVVEMENETDQRVDILMWLDDGQSLYLSLADHRRYLVDVDTGERTEISERPEDVVTSVPISPRECPHSGAELSHDDEGVLIDFEGDGEEERLVEIVGRERGFHDYQSTVSGPFFSNSCQTVIFTYDRSIWVVDVDSRVVGQLVEGGRAFMLPGY